MPKSKQTLSLEYSIFDNMLEGVQVINSSFEYIYVNKAVVKHGKKNKRALLGKKMKDAYPGIEKTYMYSLLKKCMKHKKHKQMINEFQFPDGSRGYFELIMYPVKEGVLILSIDITDLKNAEKELLSLNQHLEDRVLERTEELSMALDREKRLNDIKSSFVSYALHEIKTPLIAIKLNVNLLEMYNARAEDKTLALHYNQIKLALDSMQETINNFLSQGKMEELNESYESSVYDFPSFLKSEIEKLSIVCKTNQQIVYNHKGSLTINIDQKILKSIIGNLLSNAIKYSTSNILLQTSADKNGLKICVSDKGIGIPAGERDKMFQKFYRASNATKIRGTGLGLNIIKKYVDLMNGSISFESKQDKGTIFKVELPFLQ